MADVEEGAGSGSGGKGPNQDGWNRGTRSATVERSMSAGLLRQWAWACVGVCV